MPRLGASIDVTHSLFVAVAADNTAGMINTPPPAISLEAPIREWCDVRG